MDQKYWIVSLLCLSSSQHSESLLLPGLLCSTAMGTLAAGLKPMLKTHSSYTLNISVPDPETPTVQNEYWEKKKKKSALCICDIRNVQWMLQTKPLFLNEKEELGQWLATAEKEGSLQSSTPCWETAWHQGSIQHSLSATTTLTLNVTEKDLLVFEGKTEKHLQPWWDRERTVQPPKQQQKQATEEGCSLQCL